MRKDNIAEEALQKAYLIFSERGIQTVDYNFSHKPTDYKRGTTEEPEHVSNIDGRYAELLPENVIDGGRFEALKSRGEEVNLAMDTLQAQMRVCRERGNFQELQSCMRKMASLTKEKERLDAQMAVEDYGRAQAVNAGQYMDQDDRYSEMTEMEARIAELEAKLLEFTEKQG